MRISASDTQRAPSAQQGHAQPARQRTPYYPGRDRAPALSLDRTAHDFARMSVYPANFTPQSGGSMLGDLNTDAPSNADTRATTVPGVQTEPVNSEAGAKTETAPGGTESEELDAAPVKHPVVKPLEITRDKEVWWCDGWKPADYDVSATLMAGVAGGTGGVFRWDITTGATVVDLENDKDGMTKRNNNRIGIKSTDASAASDDVTVRCAWSHGDIASTISHKMTVRAPSEAHIIDGPIDSGFAGNIPCTGHPWCKPDDTCDVDGFRSRYVWQVRDQFGARIPAEMEVNETFGTFADDLMGNTWPDPNPVGTFTLNMGLNDDYQFVACSGRHRPDPVSPNHAHALNKVKHADQTYRAGSIELGAGRVIKTHKVQYFLGQARQV